MMEKNLLEGRIRKGVGGLYHVLCGGEEYRCRVRGIFRKNNQTPLPGDIVKIEILKDREKEGVISEIFPRKNWLIRPAVANLDLLFIVMAVMNPEPSLLTCDKLIAICEYKNIEPVLCLSKTDLRESGRIAEIYTKAGYTVLETSAVTGEGVDELKRLIGGRLCAFSGNSGVGKTSLLNGLGIGAAGEVGEISAKTERGKHTTRQVELFPYGGGFIADTPGFSNLCIEFFDHIAPRELSGCFREFGVVGEKCRFADCAHINEPDCAVKEAVEHGRISNERYCDYVALYEESQGFQQY